MMLQSGVLALGAYLVVNGPAGVHNLILRLGIARQR